MVIKQVEVPSKPKIALSSFDRGSLFQVGSDRNNVFIHSDKGSVRLSDGRYFADTELAFHELTSRRGYIQMED